MRALYSTMATKQKLLVIGNGMAGVACVDNFLQGPSAREWDITILGEEPHVNYNRILLSAVLAGEKKIEDITLNPLAWYHERKIDLRLGVKAIDADVRRKVVIDQEGNEYPYDKLLLATGSHAFIPPVAGADKKGVYTFRNMGDSKAILERCKNSKRAVVIGGGLLGLEAARGVHQQGMDTTVVHLLDRLMDMQLDAKGGAYLRRSIENLGVKVLLEKSTTEILGNGQVTGLRFKDGEEIPADMVVLACGIRPNVDLAKKLGLKINRGIVVNDHMETSDPDVFAVGECVEHDGKVYGLVAPLIEQGKITAATMAGNKGPQYKGSAVAAKLKIMGIDVFSAGSVRGDQPGDEAVSYEDPQSGIYKKVLINKGVLVGTILVGDASDANRLLEFIRSKEELQEKRKMILFPAAPAAAGSGDDVMSRSDAETICGCLGVSKGKIVTSIKEKGLKTFQAVKDCTRASTGCGTCSNVVARILKAVTGADFENEKKLVLCPCVAFSKEQIRNIIRSQKLKKVQDVLDIYGNGVGCSLCKPALSFLVDEVWCGDHEEDRSARFINDRVHGNIQKDGTFSVVPRMRGGVTTPQELRKIADVAEKYKVPMVKVTGSQRLDLLGVKKEDLPKIWAELGMPSGFAYAKAVRMVKSCVGTDFCRYGTQDSISQGIALEASLENLYTPAKVKMGVVGCPRNCAEATVKDIGMVGFDGGWNIVVGGAAGKIVREADVLISVKTKEEALRAAQLFFQYYRENGEYLERTYDFVVRLGIEKVRAHTVYAPKEEQERLLERLEKSKQKSPEPWSKESKDPHHPMQFREIDVVGPKETEALCPQGRN